MHRRAALLGWIALGASALVTCSTPERATRPPVTEYHPPPLPGFSITQTAMCSCTACSPRSCCRGEPDDESSCRETDAGTECDLAVASCTPRCARYSWRVPKTLTCSARRPTACCDGS